MSDRWLIEYRRLTRQARRERDRRNVRAYRMRQRAAGLHRVEVLLTDAAYLLLVAFAAPGEPIGKALMRALTGETEHVEKPEADQ